MQYRIGYQPVSIDSTAIPLGIRFPELEITPVVLWLDKAGVAVPAALNEVVGATRVKSLY